MRVHVIVMPRADILDPQGKAIASALASTGFPGGLSVRAGKCFAVEVETTDPDEARELARRMGDQLLANANVEDFVVRLPGEPIS